MSLQRGFEWARREAKVSQLSRLAKLAQGTSPTDWDRWFDSRSDAYTAAERLFFILEPKQDGDRKAAAAFWRGSLDDHEVKEFAEGALQYMDAGDAGRLN